MLDKYKVILWDFDGVIMDSMPIRDKGFEEVLKMYPKEEVGLLMEFHKQNGGLSRYVKFRHFFEDIRKEEVSEERIQMLADSFSKIMLSLLIDEKLLIEDSVSFIKRNWQKYEMHIVSGSDQNELRKICESLKLSQYFKSINGSPTTKSVLVENLLKSNRYLIKEVVLIGDSVNDEEASRKNAIDFLGYNNVVLETSGNFYISQFSRLKGE